MFTQIERIRVFEDTMEWIKQNQALSNSVENSKLNTEIFYENDYPDFDRSDVRKMEITITKDRSFQAAMKLNRRNPEKKIAVMNFANAFHAGGGVTSGASAQEESLCRTSTLYPVINSEAFREAFYGYHKKLNTRKASDTLMYSKDIVVCKTDDDDPMRMPKTDWVTVDVITVAAPDLRDHYGSGLQMSEEELFECHVKRAEHILTVAASNEIDILVLGAFGCGAFKNNPEVVAKAYKKVLSEFPKVFDKIEFAIYCRDGKPTRNYEVFRSVLGND